MIEDKILAAYEQMAERYNALIDTKPHNAWYDRPNTLGLIENPQGKSILDAACGPGKYAEILISQGAKVTGFDLSPNMIVLAQQRNPAAHLFVHNLSHPFPFANESFDPLQACIMPIIENGFFLDKLLEPKPTEEFAQHDPKHYAELNAFPAFMCMRAVKRG